MVPRTTNINSPMDSLEHKISIKNILINIYFLYFTYIVIISLTFNFYNLNTFLSKVISISLLSIHFFGIINFLLSELFI